MKVKLTRTYPLSATVVNAWQLLQDIKSVAECMPGAEITEKVDGTHFKGTVKVKVGPATAAFKGEIEIGNINTDNYEIHLLAKGSDVKGSSAAKMDLIARIQDSSNGQCELVGESEVTLSGKFANFGGRMMTQISDQILQQFADNFNTRVVAMGEGLAAEQAAAKVEQQPKEINGLLLVWSIVIAFFKNLGRSKSNT